MAVVNAVVVVALVLPVLGAAARPLSRRNGRNVAVLCAAGASLGWAVSVSAGTSPELGRLVFAPDVAAACAGLALLVAARLPETPLAGSAWLICVPLFAVAAAVDGAEASDRPLAVGVLVVAGIVAIGGRTAGAGRFVSLATIVAGAALTSAAAFDDPSVGAGVAIVGAVVIGLIVISRPAAAVLVPVAALVVVRAVDASLDASPAGADGALDDVAGVAGAATAVAAAGMLLLLGRRLTGPGGGPVPAVGSVVAAMALVSQDVVEVRSAGLLLLAGGVIALASDRAVALVAAVPGLVAAVTAFGRADHPVHAAAGAGAVLVLAVALSQARPLPVPYRRAVDWPVAAAFVFAVIPLWSWAGAEVQGYSSSLAGAAAAGGVVVVFTLLPMAGAPTVSSGVVGRLKRRPQAVDHGITDPLPEEAGLEEGDDGARLEAGREAQRPVAVPARAVPGRAAGSGVGGRGRLRARPGRPPR